MARCFTDRTDAFLDAARSYAQRTGIDTVRERRVLGTTLVFARLNTAAVLELTPPLVVPPRPRWAGA